MRVLGGRRVACLELSCAPALALALLRVRPAPPVSAAQRWTGGAAWPPCPRPCTRLRPIEHEDESGGQSSCRAICLQVYGTSRHASARCANVLQKKTPPAPLNVTRWLLQCDFKKSHSKCAAAFRLQLFEGVPVQWSSRRACFQRSRRSSSLVFEQVQPRVTVLRRRAGGSTVDRSVVRGLQPPRKAVPVKKPSNDSCAGGSVISFACLHAKRGKDMFFRSPAAAPRRRT